MRTEPSLDLADALLGDTDVSACAATVAYTGLPGRIDDGSKSRAYRYLYLEAGAAAQCAMLARRSGWGSPRRCAPSFTTTNWRGFCRSTV